VAGFADLAWGLEDPVARIEVLDGLRALRSGVEVIDLPGRARYPQIESPEGMATALSRALELAEGR
jgi:hypothetical protein